MEHVTQILQQVDLAWWPMWLRSMSDQEHGVAGGPDTLTSALEELAMLVSSEDADAFEEATLP